ncbi:hypothetical protein F3J24_01830 [Comamonas sp. Tr-654]|uniref:hypothetical protein n=1 Tax=Comamonas sp. Tr-654 TaxID=2608341 RepID=UPI0014221B5C|nr:hypothetical protein [Comamonas sp. Tr-654]NIF82254.1 hypothetical protein [Comamonas sp. Tr-654]
MKPFKMAIRYSTFAANEYENLQKKVLLGSVFVSMAVLAAVYGPFRCDNGCNATDMTDGLTMAFIRSTVNQQLHQEASAAGKSFSWKPGDLAYYM